MSDISEEMKKCIEDRAKAAGAVGIISGPVAHADIPVMIGIWVEMFTRLAVLSGRKLDKETAKRIAVTVIFAVGTAGAAIKTITTAVGWLTAVFTAGGSLFAAAAINGTLNYTTTRVAGHEAAELLMADKLTAENLMRAVLAALGLKFKGFGKGRDGPPDPDGFDIPGFG